MALDYDGRRFRSTAAGDDVPVGSYHQRGDTVWAEFAGGRVVIGRLVGRQVEDGTLHLSYVQLLAGGDVVAGACVSTPVLLPDGRVRLREEWRRFDAHGSTGVSWIEELPRR